MLAQPAAFSVLVAVIVSLLVCFNAEFIGQRLGVIDQPDNRRKRHMHATPLVGGIAIILPIAIWAVGALALGAGDEARLLALILLCGAGVALVGFSDDQSSSTPFSRTLFLIIFLMIGFAIDPTLVPTVLNWGSFTPTVIHPSWFYLFMAVSVVGVVNAVNMADGQNGIVASMFVIWSLCLVLVTSDPHIATFAGMAGIASAVVLIFNLRGKLFLGDGGTYGVTFVIGLLAMSAHARGDLTIETIIVWFFVPVTDCLRLLITRFMRGDSPFVGDRDHFHHRLQDKLGHKTGLAIYVGAVGGASLVASVFPHLALVCMVGLASLYFSYAWLIDPTADLAEDEHQPDGEDEPQESLENNVIRMSPRDEAR